MALIIKWGVLLTERLYQVDGDGWITEALYEEIARDLWSRMSDPTRVAAHDRVKVKVSEWKVKTNVADVQTFSSFDEMMNWLSVNKIQYLFVLEGATTLSYIDWITLAGDGTSHEWKQAKRDEQRRGEHYEKITTFARAELSGDMGQRYKLSLWCPARGTRESGGDRHLRCHRTDFYPFDNFMSGKIEEIADSLRVSADDPLDRFYKVVEAFDRLCSQYVGDPFLNALKPLAMTCGSIASRSLLKLTTGYGNFKSARRIFKERYQLPLAKDLYLRERHLLRGGINWINESRRNEMIGGVHKYDRNSSYSFEAENMPALMSAYECSESSFWNDKSGAYKYIVVVRDLKMKVKDGYPNIFDIPFAEHARRTKDGFSSCGSDEEIAFFKDELDELANWYEIDFYAVAFYRSAIVGERVFEKFVENWYGLKQKSGLDGDTALYTFSKLVLNSAFGKLTQRPDFPAVDHVFDHGKICVVESRQEPKKPNALSFIMGSYLISQGRVSLLRKIREICGDRPIDTLLYCDTDSIHTTNEAPPEFVDQTRLGFWKDEGFGFSKYIELKTYATISDDARPVAKFCAAGVRAEDVRRFISEAYGDEKLSVGLIDLIWNDGARFESKVMISGHGGRIPVYVRRNITASKHAHGHRTDEIRPYVFTDRNGEMIEVLRRRSYEVKGVKFTTGEEKPKKQQKK